VHIVSHDFAGRGFALPRLGYGLTRARRIMGLLTAFTLFVIVTPILAHVRHDFDFASDLSVYLLIVVVVSLVGGFYPAMLAAVVGSLLLNYFFAPPFHTFTIYDHDNVLALVIFVLVAVLVSRVVDLSARRSARAARSSAEAETLSNLAGSLVRGANTPEALLGLVLETFAMTGVSLLARSRAGSSWEVLAAVGTAPTRAPEADATVEISDSLVLALKGHTLTADDQRVLAAFGAQIGVAYRQWELAEAASAIEPLAESERARTALLNAVSHDLRTPIASAKAAVSSLLAADITWSPADRDELLHSAEDSLDRLTDLVTNLLDLSRLQAGVLPVYVAPVGLDEVLPIALDHAGATLDLIDVDVPDELPFVLADAGLLERVMANVVQNALRYSPDGERVRVTGSEHAGLVEVRVIDRGPGIPREEADAVFAAFQRRDDSPSGGAGVGLGLAIARGFAEAMGGGVSAEETPGGGATLVVRLRVATS
jgi:two-component system sensor histidine kinase KdpD